MIKSLIYHPDSNKIHAISSRQPQKVRREILQFLQKTQGILSGNQSQLSVSGFLRCLRYKFKHIYIIHNLQRARGARYRFPVTIPFCMSQLPTQLLWYLWFLLGYTQFKSIKSPVTANLEHFPDISFVQKYPPPSIITTTIEFQMILRLWNWFGYVAFQGLIKLYCERRRRWGSFQLRTNWTVIH